jgi:hypothetical protein
VLDIVENLQPSSWSADYAALPTAIGIDDHEISRVSELLKRFEQCLE